MTFEGQVNWKKGNVSGTVYNYDKELTKLITKVYERFLWSNPLHSDVFPGVVKMEAEVIRMCLGLFHGSSTSCGSVTSGGTESILMACLSYRNKGYKLGISHPEIVAPVTAHAAFNKACEYFGLKLISVPVDTNFQADLTAMRRAITSNTVLLVASAPQYPHGIIDDVKSIAQVLYRLNIAVSRGIGFHVDCCLGGFLLPFLNEAGYDDVQFDFAVEGVTSISADTHKYGFAPKGSSVVLYRHIEQRHLQYFSVSDWPGGIYASPSIAGSRSGAVIAGCWAAMVSMGWSGYVKSTKKIIKAAQRIKDRIKEVDGLYVLGDPKLSVIAIGSKDFDIYQLNQLMSDKGWNLNALQFPPSIHICCTMTHTQPGVVTKFLRDIKEVAAQLIQEPRKTPIGSAAMYGMAQTIPDRSIITDLTNAFLDGIYKT
ncbi:uncharacterized protein TRIADDRAFT_28705 [Trichoplax adhaerens]|uniref:sphinganine-1-phosphate aldolase n=1 Tax=Trichoplax adhaerens TaxID=10228 RepID=B3S4N5_TRIAD|nr:hypothetical protein TRIADDRAFT_28705 [Trichoplax adhaerens]EDV22663.1 hypothetical protein TRIADDRAFT_28705 [Trichoplax adhaerens]|eukprot:XP_002115207.1 hypothetical protein TRIADDRAFT_28705 [Trichoplax adhaerens]